MTYRRYDVTREVLEHVRRGGTAILTEEVVNGQGVTLVAPTIHPRDDMNEITCPQQFHRAMESLPSEIPTA